METMESQKAEFSIKLSQVENAAIRDHLQTVLELNRQISELNRQVQREGRDLELAWSAAFYRNAQEAELPDQCPPFIQDNRVTVNIGPDGTARWTEKTDG